MVVCVSVSRIINCHGPRFHPYTSPMKSCSQQRSNNAHDIHERLANMETHLKILPDTVTEGQHSYPAVFCVNEVCA